MLIKGYGEMTMQTAVDVAAAVDVHDRPDQAPRLRAELQREIVTALGIHANRALDTARRAASVLDKLNVRERPKWVRSRETERPSAGASVAALRSKPRASVA